MEKSEKKGPGRPTFAEKPASKAELAQRRTAALKTGQYAKGLRQIAPPCRRDRCMLGEEAFPCEFRRQRDSEGIPTEICSPALLNDDTTQKRLLQAMQTGDSSVLQELNASLLASGFRALESGLKDLNDNGLAEEFEILGKNGDLLGTRRITNPAAATTLQLMGILGVTADDQLLTPRSQQRAKAEESVGNLAGWLLSATNSLSD